MKLVSNCRNLLVLSVGIFWLNLLYCIENVYFNESYNVCIIVRFKNLRN